MYKVIDEYGNIIGLTNIQQVSPGETLIPLTQPGTSTINNIPINQLTPSTTKGNVTININNPVVRNDDDISKIKNEVQKGFEEAGRQFDRTGEVIPGMS